MKNIRKIILQRSLRISHILPILSHFTLVPIVAPSNVRAFDHQTTSIGLSWDFENNVRDVLGMLTGFIIFYQMANSSSAPVLQYEVQDENARQVYITGLDIYKFYKISIAGKTRIGHGVISEDVYVRTLGTGLYQLLVPSVR